jgi:hypothetical protein
MPLFLGKDAFNFFNSINIEAYGLFFIPIKVLYRNKQEFDRIYGEDINVLFESPIEIPAYIPNLNDWKNNATRFGLDETRDLVICFSIGLLEKMGLTPPDIGDRIEVQNDLYEIRQTNINQYGTNLQLPLTHSCSLAKVRPENPPDSTTVATPY